MAPKSLYTGYARETILTIRRDIMPNATISVYLSDDDYFKYTARKEEINAKVRDTVKEALNK